MTPATLQEAIQFFSDEETCVQFVAKMRWPNGTTCPQCATTNVSYVNSRFVWQCKGCRKQFSVKVGTIFEDSPIKLSKWLCAMWLLVNAKNGISSYEVARSIGVTQKSAWFMMHRIRLALQQKSITKLRQEVEVDETFIGGKARNMHAEKKSRVVKGRAGAPSGKAIVMGMLERKGKVSVHVVKGTTHNELQRVIRKNVEKGAEVFTDQWVAYNGLSAGYMHRVINHAQTYVQGHIHTNGIENFWSLLKRGLKGTYVSVEPFHLFRYLNEQAFRFNTRKRTDLERFVWAFAGIVGRRVTYPQLIGQTSH
jgi:transposase-like protein